MFSYKSDPFGIFSFVTFVFIMMLLGHFFLWISQQGVNKDVLQVIYVALMLCIGFAWVYNRNRPKNKL